MTAAWMLFALATGGALSLAALAAERVAAARRRPRRFVWLAAIGATVAWPAVAWLAAGRGGAPAAEARGAAPAAAGVARLPAVTVPAGVAAAARALDAPLLAAWGVASALLLVRLTLSAAAVRRWRRAWPAARVDGVRVRVAPDAGPAVMGLWPMDVVLPAWALALDGAERALVLRHEAEHRAARDPWLLAAAAVAAALVPWHPAVWWQGRRLRLAVEVDCDARVLRTAPHPPPARYAGLLLAVAERGAEGRAERAARGPRLAPALLGLPGVPAPRSHLERRITAMRHSQRSASRSRPLIFAAAAVAAVAAACAVEAPDRPTGPQPNAASVTAAAPAARPRAVAPTAEFFEFQVDEQATLAGPLAVRYPDALRASKTWGRVLAQFVVDTAGRVEPSSVKLLQATHPEFAEAVRAALPATRFRPALAGGRAVRQVVQLPVAFALDGER